MHYYTAKSCDTPGNKPSTITIERNGLHKDLQLWDLTIFHDPILTIIKLTTLPTYLFYLDVYGILIVLIPPYLIRKRLIPGGDNPESDFTGLV